MIICASRRTDIPAFHSEWFMNRMRAGYALVRNPICAGLIDRVSLRRQDVDCIFFMSKNPMPIEKHLDELDGIGYDYTFQVTITPYGRDVEPNVPSKADIGDCCRRISARIGRERMLWRYDPVMFGGCFGIDYHRRKFDLLCREASEWTDRCVFSFVDVYSKLRANEDAIAIRRVNDSEANDFLKMASSTAEEYGIELSYCCPKEVFDRYGIKNGGCFGPDIMKKLGIPYEIPSKPNREGCLCVKSIDIGQYDTCLHDCIYCYANSSSSDGRKRVYDPESEILHGSVGPGDTIRDISGDGNRRITDF